MKAFLNSPMVFFQHNLDLVGFFCVYLPYVCVCAKEISHCFQKHELLRAGMMNPEWKFSLISVIAGLFKENLKDK